MSSRRGRFSKTNFQSKVFLDFLIVIRTDNDKLFFWHGFEFKDRNSLKCSSV